ncbi:hypothetical protein FRC00_005117 [Tulasnella sp. 408]|nr:hypothetical protein FRC00_005117 [Tulasnella sp. 408]
MSQQNPNTLRWIKKHWYAPELRRYWHCRWWCYLDPSCVIGSGWCGNRSSPFVTGLGFLSFPVLSERPGRGSPPCNPTAFKTRSHQSIAASTPLSNVSLKDSMIPLDSPQPEYHIPARDAIPDDHEDQPVAGKSVQSESASYGLPSLIFGAAAISTVYSSQDDLESPTPFRTVRLALRYGINSFDTSPYYGASEIILGQILQALKDDYPRSSYTLITKCGRYGLTRSEFDYSPTTVRRSIERSLKRLGTTYLDTVYMHDVEFVATPVWPKPNDGNHALVLTDENLAKQWGLVKGEEDKVHGEGDQKVLDAVAELRKLQEEGVIKTVGISGMWGHMQIRG